MTSQIFKNHPIPDRVAQRALSRCAPDGSGCLISTYSVGSHGYAQVGWNTDGKRFVTVAHRAAWVARFGPIPDGMTVDHTCHTRPCVNTDHLRLLSRLENARRTNGRDWPLGTCAHGHGSEFWASVGPERLKGYCRECRRLTRLRS